MSREIKFREWDSVREEMYGKGHGMSYGEREDYDDSIGFRFSHEENLEEDRILMQYTGLKDKNGKEVYEGDIVNCSEGCPHEVIWLEEYGGRYIGGMPAWYLKGFAEGYAWTGAEEVIGNIYENPELLEQPND